MKEITTSTPYDFSLLSPKVLTMMSSDDVLDYINMTRHKYLKMHKTPITQGTGGDHRWTTRVPDKSKPDSRRVIRRSTKEEVENEVLKYYAEAHHSKQPLRSGGSKECSSLLQQHRQTKRRASVD